MARPPDADSAKTYDAIVAGALVVLEDVDHPNDLSLRKVAAQAGVSLGTINYYFESKSVLLEACLDGYYDRLRELGADLLGRARDLVGAALVEHAARSLYRWARRERNLIHLRLTTNASLGELHPLRQPEFMGTLVRDAALALAPHVHVDLLDARLAIQSLSTIFVRMALMTESELKVLTDQPGDAARAEVEQFVVRAALRLLRPGDFARQVEQEQ